VTFVTADKPAGFGDGDPSAADGRRRALVEAAVGYGLILIAIWTPLPWQRGIGLAALAWILFATVRSFDGWRAMGLGISGSLRSIWLIGVALLLAAGAVMFAGTLQILPLPVFLPMIVRRYWTYALWALLQQFVLQDFILLRLLQLMPGRAAVMIAAGLFAMAHVPNPVLMPLTLAWGLAACMLFLRYRNLYTLAMMHIIFGICVAITVPGPVDHNMRVGLGYLTYRQHRRPHRSQKDHTVSTVACVIAEAPTRRF
jgi:membrane protease YdiL (CAAX protease family)